MAAHNEIGKRGETLAAQHLEQKGYTIVAKNWHYQKAEIDLIAIVNNQLIMVEVKTRTSAAVENPQNAVTLAKQRRMIKAANAFIEQNELDLECRFDIVAIILESNATCIEHIEDAFYPPTL